MANVRVDFFRPTGKWYTTEEIEFVNTNSDINFCFAASLYRHLQSGLGMRLDDMVAVCITPDHPFSHPLIMHVEDIFKYLQIDESNVKTASREYTPSEDDFIGGY